jgi:hypothetical protein
LTATTGFGDCDAIDIHELKSPAQYVRCSSASTHFPGVGIRRRSALS